MEELILKFLGINAVSNTIRDIERDLGGLQAAADASGGSIASSLSSAGGAMLSAARVIGGATVLGAFGIGAFIKEAAGLEYQLNLLQTHANAIPSTIGDLKNAFMELGPQVGFTATQLATADYYIQSAGWHDVTNNVNILTAAARTAQMTHADLAQTTYSLVTTMQAMPGAFQNASQYAGALNAIVGSGIMTFDELNKSLKTGLFGTGQLAGQNLEAMGALMDTLTTRGFPASTAAMTLRNIMVQLPSHMDNASSASAKAFAMMGLSQNKVAEDMTNHGLIYALNEFKSGLATLDPARQLEVMGAIFRGTRGAGQAGTMIEALNSIPPILTDIQGGIGNFDANWAKTAGTATAETAMLKAGFADFAISMGDALLPTYKRVATGLLQAMQGIWKFIEAHKALIAEIIPAAIKIGAFLTLILGLGGIALKVAAIFASPFALAIAVAVAAFGVFASNTGLLNKAIQTLTGGSLSDLMAKLHDLGNWFNTVARPALVGFGQWFATNVVPPLVAFAGYMIGTIIPHVASVIAVIVKAGVHFAEFAAKVIEHFGFLVPVFAYLENHFHLIEGAILLMLAVIVEGKILRFAGEVGSLVSNVVKAGTGFGSDIASGIRAIGSAASSVYGAVSTLVDKLLIMVGLKSPGTLVPGIANAEGAAGAAGSDTAAATLDGAATALMEAAAALNEAAAALMGSAGAQGVGGLGGKLLPGAEGAVGAAALARGGAGAAEAAGATGVEQLILPGLAAAAPEAAAGVAAGGGGLLSSIAGGLGGLGIAGTLGTVFAGWLGSTLGTSLGQTVGGKVGGKTGADAGGQAGSILGGAGAGAAFGAMFGPADIATVPIGAAIGAIVGSIPVITSHWGQITGAIGTAFGAVKTTVQGSYQTLSDHVGGFFGDVGGVFKNAPGAIADGGKKVIGDLADFFGNDIGGFFHGMPGHIADLGKGVIGHLGGFFGHVGDVLNPKNWGNYGASVHNAVAKGIGALSDFFGTTLPNAAKGAFQTLNDHVGGFFGTIGGWFKSLPGDIKGAWDTVTTDIKGFFTNDVGGFFHGLPGHMKDAWDTTTTDIKGFFTNDVGGFFHGLPGHVKGAWDTTTTDIKGFFTNDVGGFFHGLPGNIKGAWDTTTTGIKNFFVGKGGLSDFFGQTVPNALKGPMEGFKNSVLTLINGLIDGVKGIYQTLSDKVGGAFGSFGQGVADFFHGLITGHGKAPGTAGGGYFEQDTTIRVGEAGPEWVLNVPMMKSLLASRPPLYVPSYASSASGSAGGSESDPEHTLLLSAIASHLGEMNHRSARAENAHDEPMPAAPDSMMSMLYNLNNNATRNRRRGVRGNF